MANTTNARFEFNAGELGRVETNRNVKIGSNEDATPGYIQQLRKQLYFWKLAGRQTQMFEGGSVPFIIGKKEGVFTATIPTTGLIGEPAGLWNTLTGADLVNIKQESEMISLNHYIGFRAIWDKESANFEQDPSATTRITELVKEYNIARLEDQFAFGDFAFGTQKARDGQFRKINYDLNESNKYNAIELVKLYPYFSILDLGMEGLSIPSFSMAKSTVDLGEMSKVGGEDKRVAIGSALSLNAAELSKISFTGICYGIKNLLLNKLEKARGNGNKGIIFVTSTIFHTLITSNNDNITKSLYLNMPFQAKQNTVFADLEEYTVAQNDEVINNINGFEIVPFIYGRNIGGYRLKTAVENNSKVGGQLEGTSELAMLYVLSTEGIISFPSEEKIVIVPETSMPDNNLTILKYNKLICNAVSVLGASNLLPVYQSTGKSSTSVLNIYGGTDNAHKKLKKSDFSLNGKPAEFNVGAELPYGLDMFSDLGTKGYFAVEILPASAGYQSSPNPFDSANVNGAPLRSTLLMTGATSKAADTSYPYKSALDKTNPQYIVSSATDNSQAISLLPIAGIKETDLQIRIVKYSDKSNPVASYLVTNTVIG